MNGGAKACQVRQRGGKKTRSKPGATPNVAVDVRLAPFIASLADLLVADLLRKPNDKR